MLVTVVAKKSTRANENAAADRANKANEKSRSGERRYDWHSGILMCLTLIIGRLVQMNIHKSQSVAEAYLCHLLPFFPPKWDAQILQCWEFGQV